MITKHNKREVHRIQETFSSLTFFFRYEYCWIPLIAANSKGFDSDLQFTPPIDVLWVWHVHMLAPQHYYRDLKRSVLGR